MVLLPLRLLITWALIYQDIKRFQTTCLTLLVKQWNHRPLRSGYWSDGFQMALSMALLPVASTTTILLTRPRWYISLALTVIDEAY